MVHGTEFFFIERARSRRRVSSITLAVAALFLAGLSAVSVAPLERIAEEIPILRFGYEGPEQYVRHIELLAEIGPPSRNFGPEPIYVPPAQRGGAKPGRRSRDPRAAPETRLPGPEEGDAAVDRLARSRANAARVPLVQSEDLVIERLVRPNYPDLARERGIEGKVAVLALVDTLGYVKSVEVVGASEGGVLERAAEDAVWQCRFRPYLQGGRKQTVFAMFRFAFRLND
jgi:TonB family protein